MIQSNVYTYKTYMKRDKNEEINNTTIDIDNNLKLRMSNETNEAKHHIFFKKNWILNLSYHLHFVPDFYLLLFFAHKKKIDAH